LIETQFSFFHIQLTND